MSIKSKVALVTGGSRGIGRAIAVALGREGAIVIGTATTDEGAKQITTVLQSEQVEGMGYALNVCDDNAIQETLAAIQAKFGEVSILVNNAGITRDNLLMRMKPDQWDEVIDTNLTAVYRLTKSCLRSMVKARWGRVINISSVVASIGNPGQVNYCAAKAGIIGFSKALAQEVAAYGITINTVSPGFIDTDMTRDLSEKQQDMIMSRIPMKRIGEPLEVAAAVTFLASANAAYITGQTLHVNGGMCMV